MVAFLASDRSSSSPVSCSLSTRRFYAHTPTSVPVSALLGQLPTEGFMAYGASLRGRRRASRALDESSALENLQMFRDCRLTKQRAGLAIARSPSWSTNMQDASASPARWASIGALRSICRSALLRWIGQEARAIRGRIVF